MGVSGSGCGFVLLWVTCFILFLDTVLRCCPTQDHNFYLILRNTTHNNGIAFILILLLYFHIIILIITVNKLMKEYMYIYILKF